MTIEQLMERVGCAKWPERWNTLYDDVRADFEKNGCLYLTPAYYEKTLKGAYVRDDESIDMLDIIFGNRVYDVGHLYMVGTLPHNVTQLLVNNNPGGLTSVYQSFLNLANSDIRELNQRIEMLKNS